jgi:hypothetical protein
MMLVIAVGCIVADIVSPPSRRKPDNSNCRSLSGIYRLLRLETVFASYVRTFQDGCLDYGNYLIFPSDVSPLVTPNALETRSSGIRLFPSAKCPVVHTSHQYYHTQSAVLYTYTKVGGVYFRESFGSTSGILPLGFLRNIPSFPYEIL